MEKLAILGGKPVRTKPFPAVKNIGKEEIAAVNRVLKSGVLSKFLGVWHKDFYGGPGVQKLEKNWAAHFGVKHAISVNSATSGLYAAVAATGVGPGDEVIVSPYTMSASAAGILVCGAVPVFADIDPKTYCISAETIKKVLTRRTKAIVVVDIFGYPADFDGIMALARKYKLTVVEDAAQAPGAKYKGRWAGTLGDVGVFSLNYHKTIHSGEGGIVVTNNDDLANRIQLIRNHAETVVKAKGDRHLAHLIGFNYRMTEIEAAIAAEQLKKLEKFTKLRIQAAEYINHKLKGIPWLKPFTVQAGRRHVYYVLPFQYDEKLAGVPRESFVKAVAAEGVPFAQGYVEPLYMQPIYQKRASICSYSCPKYKGKVSYAKGICPVTEEMHYKKLVFTTLVHHSLSRKDVEDVAIAVVKVADNIGSLPR
ncbi:MAG: DegT/DnrJ/EryC1/StrS aminotransferase [Candidatus Raymondbacteria bacterium RifOxyA12_full_50_37]|nr:MAG: DegT/DnrJ/EryC1/StrS aminotransferase [Candidatus Raymondbacteria bacterium RifOxyA12_full_50_37]OGJ88515.1 MAG: DegT/DnrJ/EryC1/StrS aminotransferase [Candidatus Raymondbacteria bacterium RIFOXYA2_FULL_49_16]OGJ98976.1 MAG: DegT/DnrJ/EryC1/StrS aminotransferase [Candidatus Raymondbacteria bacterium RIFOXYC2_FULL_50_21]OGP41486.1 MAG: DegT/DnrJ/EryC1/StrS aminotransferase [Candidatus Raymondbacteria bacterium RIFOXYB2_FULL_49_35]